MGRKKHQWTRDADTPEGEVHYTERATWASQKKATQQITDLSKALVRIKPEVLGQLPIPESVGAALEEAHRLKRKGSVRGGMRRQMLHLASVIRALDVDELSALADAIDEHRGNKKG